MKKFFMFAAAAMMVLSVASCKKDNGKEGGETVPEVKTAAENLVVHLPLTSAAKAVAVGEGITFASVNGAAGFGEGEIGTGYTNTAANNDEAYLKFDVAKSNPFTTMESITLTVWVKNNTDFSKGAILSFNGTNPSGDWPAFNAYFDNKAMNEETSVETQQVNGRIVFNVDNHDVNLWMDTWDPAFAKYDKWFQFAFTYDAASGAWALYSDGQKVKEAEFGDKLPFYKALPTDFNAIYVGGWASRIDGKSSADWQTYFAGSLDEIRIYDKALSESEVLALYKEELAIALQ